jgi:ATP-dependent Lon protease
MARLHPVEREFVRTNLKRKARTDLVKRLQEDTKRSRDHADTPLRIQVLQSGLPPTVRTHVFDELQGCVNDKFVHWVRRLLRIPFGVLHVPKSSLSAGEAVARARAAMDSQVTGHAAAKHEVLAMVCQERQGGTCAGRYPLGLEGPPGTGKTHFVKHALAPALDRPMVSIPLGGAADISYLLGNMYTYEGSKEGRLVAALVEANCCNPIIYFDEVDKISATDRGQEIVSVLIHLVDPTANSALRDRYFHNVDLDFSKCTFVFSYNDATRISPVLLDRIKRVRMLAPSDGECETILRTHLVPRVQRRLNTSLLLSDEAVRVVLAKKKDGCGMRTAEKDVDHVLAAAQLNAVETETHDGEVSGAFATAVLATHADEGEERPPTGMYL